MISRVSLIALIQSKCQNELKYVKTKMDEDESYIEIFRRPYDSAIIGINKNGYWCVVHNDIMYSLENTKDADVFLLVLYTPLQEILALIKKGLLDINLPVDITLTFPFDKILEFALNSKWHQKAISWIDEGYPIDDNMREIIYGTDKQTPQWLEYEGSRKGHLLNL